MSAAAQRIALTTPAYSLIFIPTFDGSITNNVNGAALQAAISNAMSVFHSTILDNVVVKVHFTNDETVGLGQSSTAGNTFSYAAFLAALQSHATSANDFNGLSKIPNTATDPVIGGTDIYINYAPARLLGLSTSYGDDGFDSTVALQNVC